MLGEERLGMELHALPLVLPVPEAHDLALGRPRGHLEHIVNRIALHDERVIARRREWARETAEYALAAVLDRAKPAKEDRCCPL